MTKRFIHRASADVGLMFVAYNFRRLLNILDQNVFKAFLEMLAFTFLFKSLNTVPVHAGVRQAELCHEPQFLDGVQPEHSAGT
jgi:hypothetical protein